MSRTFERLQPSDLAEVRDAAMVELTRFLNVVGTPPGKYHRYANRLVGICLAQGAAQHFVDLQDSEAFDNEVVVSSTRIQAKGFRVRRDGRVISGVKDIDVWLFFRHDRALPIPTARHARKSVEATLHGLGERRLDFMKKGIAPDVLARAATDDPEDVIRAYIENTAHGHRYLSKKSMIGLYPDDIFAKALWRTRRRTSGWSGPA